MIDLDAIGKVICLTTGYPPVKEYFIGIHSEPIRSFKLDAISFADENGEVLFATTEKDVDIEITSLDSIDEPTPYLYEITVNTKRYFIFKLAHEYVDCLIREFKFNGYVLLKTDVWTNTI